MSSGLNVDTLIALHESGASEVKLTFTDTFENITGSTSFDSFDGVGGNTYLLQKLQPGVPYRLTFDILTETSPGSGSYANAAQNITAADVFSSSSLGDTPVENNYFFNTDGVIRYVAFKTTIDDQVSVAATGMTRHDTTVELYRPHSTAAYTGFTSSPSYYHLSATTGQPSDFLVAPIKHNYDGYLFLFYHQNTLFPGNHVLNTNASLTSGLRNGKFIGKTAADPLKGFKRIVDIHSSRVDGIDAVSVNFTKADFEAGGVFGEGLEKNGKYIIGLVLHDKNSDYIPYEYDSGTAEKLIKWYSIILNEAGNWQIFLKNFVNVNTHNSDLHPSTAAGIHIDSISTVGSFSSTDNIRIVMTATPFTP